MTSPAETDAREQNRLIRDQQAALRRVATLVARGATAAESFAAVAAGVAEVLDGPAVMLARYEPDRMIRVLASVGDPAFTEGSLWPLDGPSVSEAVFDTGRSARIDDYSELPGSIAAGARESGLRGMVGGPIVVDGNLWGVITVGTQRNDPLPADAEAHLREFSELVAMAISNAESRDRLRRLADEQAALRHVATLVAEGSRRAEIFSAVAEEVARILDVSSVSVVRYEPEGSSVVVASFNDPAFPVGSRWPREGPSLNATVFETGRPARIDHAELPGPVAAAARESRVQSGVGVPIMVDRSVWGMIAVGSRDRSEPLAPETEERLAAFTELVATAISNAEARDRRRRLADEQAALHRVAALVARAAPANEVFALVSEEVARLFGLPRIELARYEDDGTATVIGAAGEHPFPPGSNWTLDGPSIMDLVLRTGRPARIDDYSQLPGTIAKVAREAGFTSAIGAPIVVDGATWGLIVAISTSPEPIPEGSELRLGLFTELVATALSNLQAHDDLRGLATQQASLRRVATLVAEGATAQALFAAVAREVAEVLGVPVVTLLRYEPGRTITILASENDPTFPAGSRWPLDGVSVTATVLDTGRPARIDDFSDLSGTLAEATRNSAITASVGVPIVVDGTVWGMLAASATESEPLPARIENSLSDFTELLATAITDTESRDRVRRLADEQAALRRVATLVAEGSTSEELFSAVATEVAQVLHVSGAVLDRYEPDGTAVTLAVSHDPDWEEVPAIAYPGKSWPLEPGSLPALVYETRRAARVDDYSDLEGSIGDDARAVGVGAGCAAPIIVDGKLWGLIRAFSRRGATLPGGIESQLHAFTELVATALSNAAVRDELIASRARIVAAGDEARRRIERNLHDGTQQRLIALGLDLQRIEASLPEDQIDARDGLERMGEDLESLLDDVRELSRGLHPPLLSRGGLRPSLRALTRRSPIPVDLDIELHERPPEAIETALYYVASEALTNAIKHSQASTISVTVETDHAGVPFGIGIDGGRGVVNLQATITDDGVGGAVLTEGSGLMGLVDRVDALGGRLTIDSPSGLGTRVSVLLPLGTQPATR